MKKIFILLPLVWICFPLFAQHLVSGSQKGICTDPQVTIVPGAVEIDMFTMSFLPNEACAYYHYVTIPTSEIDMWTSVLGMTAEQLTVLWGIQASDTVTYTWTDLIPDMDYTVFALPFGSDSAQGVLASYELTTGVLGDTGVSVITIAVDEITDTSAHVTCTPNEHTALFYDGLITQEYYDEIGQDSAVAYFIQNTMPLYAVDSWTWQGLQPNTPYYVLAIGQNANQEWGEPALYPFSTLVGIADYVQTDFSIFPLPNTGDFFVKTNGMDNTDLQIFSLTGQLCAQYPLSQTTTAIHTQLAPGTYLLRVLNKQGQVLGVRKMIVR